MRSSSVKSWKGFVPLRGKVSSSTMLAVFGDRRFTVSLLTPARRHRLEKDQSFIENAPSLPKVRARALSALVESTLGACHRSVDCSRCR